MWTNIYIYIYMEVNNGNESESRPDEGLLKPKRFNVDFRL